MKKLSNYLKDNETVTLAELYRRVYGERGSIDAWAVFDCQIVQKDKSVIVIPYTDHSPIFIKKKKNFFKKVLDFLKHLCYNNYRN